jgi:hypothetical protein
MPNEVIIRVRAINDTKVVFDKIRAEARDLGETVAININEHVTQRLERDAQAATGSNGGYARTGDLIGETIGKRVAERITEHINVNIDEKLRETMHNSGRGNDNGREKVNVDVHDREKVTVDVNVDKKSFFQQISSLGADIKDKVSGFFSGGIADGMRSVFGSDVFSMIIKGGLVALGGTVLAPILGATITSGILVALGGGAIGLGIAASMKSYSVKSAFGELKKEVTGLFGASGTGTGKKKTEDTFGSFGSYFTGPVRDFIGMLTRLLEGLKPTINEIGRAFGPVTDSLAHGIIGFLQNALPGVLRAIKSAEPLIKTLADNMPAIGDAIGRFFDHIRKGAPNANVFFDDLLHILPLIIRALGILIQAFTTMYRIFRDGFLDLMAIAADWAVAVTSSARIAFGWVPGLGPKLDAAARKAADFKKSVNKQLDGIHDVDVSVKIRVAGMGVVSAALDAFHALGLKPSAHAHGGIIGAAATGGARGGMTLVGERGPELINAAPGSQVYSNADSARMLGGGGGGGGSMVINLVVDGMVIARAMADPMRKMVLNQYGGDVQSAYGR